MVGWIDVSAGGYEYDLQIQRGERELDINEMINIQLSHTCEVYLAKIIYELSYQRKQKRYLYP